MSYCAYYQGIVSLFLHWKGQNNVFLVGKFVLQRKPKKRVFSFSHIAPFRQGVLTWGSVMDGEAMEEPEGRPGGPGVRGLVKRRWFPNTARYTNAGLLGYYNRTLSFFSDFERMDVFLFLVKFSFKPGKHRKVPVNQEKMFFLVNQEENITLKSR